MSTRQVGDAGVISLLRTLKALGKAGPGYRFYASKDVRLLYKDRSRCHLCKREGLSYDDLCMLYVSEEDPFTFSGACVHCVRQEYLLRYWLHRWFGIEPGEASWIKPGGAPNGAPIFVYEFGRLKEEWVNKSERDVFLSLAVLLFIFFLFF